MHSYPCVALCVLCVFPLLEYALYKCANQLPIWIHRKKINDSLKMKVFVCACVFVCVIVLTFLSSYSFIMGANVFASLYACVTYMCVCMCVCARTRMKDRECQSYTGISRRKYSNLF